MQGAAVAEWFFRRAAWSASGGLKESLNSVFCCASLRVIVRRCALRRVARAFTFLRASLICNNRFGAATTYD